MISKASCRAQIVNNELDAESKSPANVILQNHASTGGQAPRITAGSSELGESIPFVVLEGRGEEEFEKGIHMSTTP